MTRQSRPAHALAIVACVCAVIQPSIAPLLEAQAAAPGSAAAAPAPDVDGGWPRDYATASGAAIRMFQPQIGSWDGQRHMVAYGAVSYSASGAAKPSLGTVKIEAETSVALGERLVNFSHPKLTETHFPDLSRDQLRELAATLTDDVQPGPMLIALDRVLARLDKSPIVPKNVEGVKADPPAIFYSTAPAILVNLDGDPIWSPIKDNDLTFAVNTNWDLFQHSPTRTFYLRYNHGWLSAADVRGPWKAAAGKLPLGFASLPADENWKDVKAAVPGQPLSSAPRVFVNMTPAEMILTRGAQ